MTVEQVDIYKILHEARERFDGRDQGLNLALDFYEGDLRRPESEVIRSEELQEKQRAFLSYCDEHPDSMAAEIHRKLDYPQAGLTKELDSNTAATEHQVMLDMFPSEGRNEAEVDFANKVLLVGTHAIAIRRGYIVYTEGDKIVVSKSS